MTWYNASWNYRLKVTVDHTKVGADLTDYPGYVNLTDVGSGHGFWTHVKSDGGDIRVTKTDGTTEVPVELVSINTTTKVGELYFKAAGTLSSSTDTDYYVYYGNASASAAAASDTYGRENVWNSGFKLVAHMAQDPSGSAPQIIDSTVNHNNGTSAGSMTSGDLVTAKVYNGLDMDGTDDVIDFGAGASLDITSNLTVLMWANGGATTGEDIAGKRTTTNTATSWGWNTDQNVEADGSDFYVSSLGVAASATGKLYRGGHFWDSTWRYMGMTFTSGDLKIYNQGVDITSTMTKAWDGTVTSLYSSASSLKVGLINSSTTFKCDELRISNVVRAASWISTEYANMNSSSTFYTIASEEAGADTTAPTLSSSTPADNAVAVAIDSNIVLNFSETVQKGTGNFYIKLYSDDSTIQTIDVTTAAVTVSSAQVTINPGSDLTENTHYYLTADSGVIKDVATTPNNWAGISSKTVLDFTTREAVSPTLTSTTPADNATGASLSNNLQMVFSETVNAGLAGKIKLRKLDHLYIGKSNDNATTALMKLGEILMFRRQLTTEERQKLEGYLLWKWDGTGNLLPSDHPYKGQRPYRV